MRENFNNSFSLINEINAIKENISNELEYLESIEKIENECASIAVLNLNASYFNKESNAEVVVDANAKKQIEQYIKDNFFTILRKIKEENTQNITKLQEYLTTKALELEQETNK